MDLTRLGRCAIVGAVLAIIGNTALLFVDPAVPDTVLSHPLSTGAYAVAQVFFAVTQGLMTAGVLGLVLLRPAGSRRVARVLGVMAVGGMALTVPGELVLVAVADQAANSDAAGAASSVFGLGLLVADLGLIGLGIAARRQGAVGLWWALPLALGLWQLLVVTPVSFAAGFASVASYVVIALADLLVVLLGVALVRRGTRDHVDGPVPVGGSS